MKHIGIAAVSYEGAALCYRTICSEAVIRLGSGVHPEITIHTFAFEEYMKCIRAGDWAGVADLLLSSAEKLKAAGAEFAICPANTAHEAFPHFGDRSPLPWLHIGEVVAAAAKQCGYTRLAVLGTKYLMEGAVYPTALGKLGISSLTPDESERQEINRSIYDELVRGQLRPKTKQFFTALLLKLKDRGADAVVLGCTEIPLLIQQSEIDVPLLDSTKLLAQAAVTRGLE